MRKAIVILVAASVFIAAAGAVATAQVTGIRHSDGSWTFVDANGRDIHKNRDAAARNGRTGTRGGVHTAGGTSRHDRENHKVTGYLPWLSR
jgi:hypothetical protein